MAKYGASIYPDPHTIFSVTAFNVYVKNKSTGNYELKGRATAALPIIIWGTTSKELVDIKIKETGCTDFLSTITLGELAEDIAECPVDLKFNGCRIRFRFPDPAPSTLPNIKAYISSYTKSTIEDCLSAPISITQDGSPDHMICLIKGAVNGLNKYFHFTYPRREPVLNVQVTLVNQETVTVDVPLVAKLNDLTITSFPSGAFITLNSEAGELTGFTTPHTFLQVECLEYTVTLTKYGYLNAVEKIDLQQGVPLEAGYTLGADPDCYGIALVSPLPSLGQTEVIYARNMQGDLLTPQGTKVFTAAGLGVIGRYHLFRGGYIPIYNYLLYCDEPEGMQEFYPVFTRINGTVAINSNPPGAAIWINGYRQSKKTPCEVNVVGGTKSIKLVKPGYYNKITTAYIGYPNEMYSDPITYATVTETMELIPSDRGLTLYLDNRAGEFDVYANICPIYKEYAGRATAIAYIDSSEDGIATDSAELPIYRMIEVEKGTTFSVTVPLPTGIDTTKLYYYFECWGTAAGALTLKHQISPVPTLNASGQSSITFVCESQKLTTNINAYSLPLESSVMATFYRDGVQYTESAPSPHVWENVDAYIPASENRHLATRGEHTFRFSKTGFLPITKTVRPAAGGTLDLQVDFTAFSGYFELRTIPFYATIYNEEGEALNEPVAETDPLFSTKYPYMVLSGIGLRRRFVLKSPTHYDTVVYLTFNGEPGHTIQQTVYMSQYASDLQITTDPPGAKIYMDEFDTGEVTPFTFPNTPVGFHDIALDLAEHCKWTGKVLVESNKTTELHVPLQVAIAHDPLINTNVLYF